jgi:hypothetical protein
MADPVTIGIAVVGAAASFAGSMVSAAGQEYDAGAKANMLNYQKSVAMVNKNIAEQNAAYERYTGEVSAQESGMKTRYEVGVAKATQAGSGLDVNTGSTADVRKSMQEVGYQDEALIRANAARRAYGSEVEAFTKGTDAVMYGAGATTARKMGDIGATASILGGASSVADKWLQASKQFGGGSTSNPTSVGPYEPPVYS